MKNTIRMMSLFAAAAAIVCATGCMFSAKAFDHSDEYTAGDFSTNSEVKALDIDWTSGSVTVSHHDQSDVTVTETYNGSLKDAQKLQTWLEGSTLHIRYCKSGLNFNLKNPQKHLEIKLPEGVDLDSLKCDCTSADTSFSEISADSFEVDITSGTLLFDDCTADKFNIDSTSGDITVNQKGSSETMKVESTSGKINITADTVRKLNVHSTSGDTEIHANKAEAVSAKSTSGVEIMYFGAVPSSADINTTSGDVSLYLPKNADFAAVVDTCSGKFNSDISCSKDGGTYTAGSGANQFRIETTSGDIAIRSND